MQHFKIASLPILALLVLAALLYLTVSIVNLLASASGVSANCRVSAQLDTIEA